MSEYITHVAVLDDCRNLVLFASEMSEMKQSLRHHQRASRLGAITSKGDSFTVDLLIESKKAWPGDVAEQLLAFFFGWRSHIAADRQFKTLFRLLEPEIYATEKIDGPTSISIYHDLFVLRELYNDDEQSPFVKEMLEPKSNVGKIEPLFVELWQNSLLDLHSFANKNLQPELWFEKFLQHRQKFYVDAERYVTSYNNLDNDKMRYVVETNRFYDRFDPLIKLTRSLRQGKPDLSIDFESALEQAKSQSHYARALRRNWLYLQATNAFWQGEIDAEELQTRFEVDESHTESKVYQVHNKPEYAKELLQEWHETGGQK